MKEKSLSTTLFLTAFTAVIFLCIIQFNSTTPDPSVSRADIYSELFTGTIAHEPGISNEIIDPSFFLRSNNSGNSSKNNYYFNFQNTNPSVFFKISALVTNTKTGAGILPHLPIYLRHRKLII